MKTLQTTSWTFLSVKHVPKCSNLMGAELRKFEALIKQNLPNYNTDTVEGQLLKNRFVGNAEQIEVELIWD